MPQPVSALTGVLAGFPACGPVPGELSVGAIGWSPRPPGAPGEPRRPGVPVAPLPDGSLFRTCRSPLGEACRAREGATPAPAGGRVFAGPPRSRYLVDSASSHMLVSKIKPCMSKFKRLNGETANGSLNQLSFI